MPKKTKKSAVGFHHLLLIAGFVLIAYRLPFERTSDRLLGAESSAAATLQDPGVDPIADDRGEGPTYQIEREDWFYGQRTYPADEIPLAARLNARKYAIERVPDLLQASRAIRSAAALPPWRSIGPAPISTRSSGRVSAIAVDPKDPRIVFIGGAQGGIWKTLDGGTSWRPLTDDQPSLAIGAIAIDPVNTNIIYVGTGEANFSFDSYYGAGLLRSADGGQTWAPLAADTFARNAISRLIVDPHSAGSLSRTTLYASSTPAQSNFTLIGGPPSGVFVSRDSGQTWTLLKQGGPVALRSGGANQMVMDPLLPNTLYAAFTSLGIFKSEDGGLSWRPLTNGLPASGFGRISLAIAQSAPQTLLAGYERRTDQGTQGLLGVFKTLNGGETWQPTSSPQATCQCWYDSLLAIDPDDPQTFYWGGVTLHKSTNGGMSWLNITRNIHVDQHAIAFGPTSGSPADGRTVFVGNDGGVWRSESAGGSWTSANEGLAITQFIGVASHPTNAQIAYGGTQDNGSLKYEGNTIWRVVLGCDGGYAAVDAASPSTVYATTQSNGCNRVARSEAEGASFQTKTAGISILNGAPDGRALFYAPLEISREDPRTLYYASFRVYRTTNRGDSWMPISPDLTRGPSSGALRPVISSLGPGPGGSLYVGTGDGKVQATFDQGATWHDLTKLPLPNRFVTRLSVDPDSAQIVYATFSGFDNATPETPGHIFRTMDGGTTWADVSGNLPDIPVNSIVIDPRSKSNARVIFVGTDIGVFMSVIGGTQWIALNDGLPNVAVLDLDLNTQTDILRAATHGRSVFDLTNVSQVLSAARKLNRVISAEGRNGTLKEF